MLAQPEIIGGRRLTKPIARPKVFISYSHRDEIWKDRLLRHLNVAGREGAFDLWDDRRLQAGDDWYAEIVKAIEGCDVAILLISADFLNSDFIVREEVPRLLEKHAKERARVFPVILKSCLWKKIPWLSRLNARPTDGDPLSRRRGNRLEDELTRIASELWDQLAGLSTSADPAMEHFIASYRQRLSSAFSRWDLGTTGVAQAGGADRPIEAGLDDMYLPLRLANGFDLSRTDQGRPLSPEQLLHRSRPLAIRGPAGSGKTTWMRWSFRQLLRLNSALPLMLVLRDLARKWHEPGCHGAARSLDSCLDDWVAMHGLEPEGILGKVLNSEIGPRPVLLVDGWDEIGPLGEELRQKLIGFLAEHPRILAIVSSRPYGEGRPSHAEGFEVLDLQPLSNSEIAKLCRRFFQHCYGEDEGTIEREAERFLRALNRSSDAQALARTALLLTMMLLIGRARPLPDKRHLLYEACIENLLTALPNRKEEEGALLLRDQWRPDDSEERLRVVAALAAAMQEVGYRTWERSPIVGTWEGLADFLPKEWSEKRRHSFLAWLAGPAGLLTDRTDRTLCFSHLSFQEFLTAWHLNASIEGAEPRIEAFRERLKDFTWWETLRLWAALIQRQSRDRLDPVLHNLAEGGDIASAFAGAVFADGLGLPMHFEKWKARFVQMNPSKQEVIQCASAWSASRQDPRRESLSSALSRAAADLSFWSYLRCQQLAEKAALDIKSPLRPSAAILWAHLRGGTLRMESLAYGRVLCGGPPGIWPIEPIQPGLLQAWPGERRQIGLRLQMAQTHGASRAELSNIFNGCIQNIEWSDRDRHVARYLAHNLSRMGSRDLARHVARNWARYLARDQTRSLARNLISYFSRDWAREWIFYWACDLARGDMAHHQSRDWARYLVEEVARQLKIERKPAWFESFIAGEIYSAGRSQARAALVNFAGTLTTEHKLIAEACRLSFALNTKTGQLGKFIKQLDSNVDPLWPALARHIARRSTKSDRELLTDLAKHPEKREPPISWGLQFIVRGDVMMDDGSVISLDELSDELFLPRLPYLEDMPDELEAGPSRGKTIHLPY